MIQNFQLSDEYFFTDKEIKSFMWSGISNLCLSDDGLPYFAKYKLYTDWNFAQKIIQGLIKFYSIHSENDINILNQEIENQLHQKETNSIPKKLSKAAPIQGYIYFLRADNQVVKIGKATNLENRFDQIQPQLPFKTKVIHVFKAPDFTLLEKKFHELFADKRVNGEWFKLTDIDIENIKCRILPQDILDLIIEEK